MVEVFKGTTTVGIVCKDGVVLASESRATMGHFIASTTAQKIYQIADRVGLTTAGVVGDAQSLVRMIQVESRLYNMQRGEPMTVKGTTSLLSNVLSSRRYFPLMVQLLLGGVLQEQRVQVRLHFIVIASSFIRSDVLAPCAAE